MKLLGHASAYAPAWPRGSDLHTVSHFVTKLLGHTALRSFGRKKVI